MDVTGDLLGSVSIGLGVVLAIAASKRKFARTNALGIERFSTFGAKLRARSADYLLKGSAICAITVGAIMLASNHLDTWGWIVMGPVCLFILYLLLGS